MRFPPPALSGAGRLPLMRPQLRWPRLLGLVLLIVVSLGNGGCLGIHSIPPLAPDVHVSCKAFPTCCRDHVHVFFIHGMDPFDWANLTGLRDHVQALGFHKTYYGQMYHTRKFEKEIRRIHEEDPNARFVLVGFSFGANMVRYLAN